MTSRRSVASSPSHPPQPTQAPDELKRTKYQRFRKAVVARSAIQGFPRNPRKITAEAKKRLEDNLRTRGEMGNIVVNEPTMQVVSGHRRLAALDALEGKSDYGVEVNLVTLTEQEAAEQLLFMNNYHAQGDWDASMIPDFLKEYDVRLDPAGFDPFDLQAILDVQGVQAEMSSIFNADNRPDAVRELEAEMTAIKPAPETVAAAKAAVAAAELATPEGIAALKEAKAEHKAAALERDDGTVYLILTTASAAERKLIAAWFGLDEREIYLSVERFRSRLARAGLKEIP